jgi:hypothetical protein
MATKRLDISPGMDVRLDTGVFLDVISNQITPATSPSVGQMVAVVLADNSTDEGWHDRFEIPQEYVNTPKVIVKGILDGAPGASDSIAFGFRYRAVATNEAADGTLGAEDKVTLAIGSGSYSDEDHFEASVTLTSGFAAGDDVYFYFYLDVTTGTSYSGNVLITGLDFEFVDA